MSAAVPPSLPKSISAMSHDEVVELFKSWGEPGFRAQQLREFVFRKGVASYDDVTNLSKSLRERLKREAPLYELQPVGSSEGDDATKWLWKAADGAMIESVQIRTPDRNTSCLSSQVGCAMGCTFCATGLSGFERHLKAHEIIEQYLQMWGRSKVFSTHVVYMGMGEPLHNYDAVMESVRLLNTPPPKGVGIGARRITISTVGIVPGIRRLADEKLQLELAISLHAPDEETRRQLIPVSKRYPISEVMDAVEEFSRKTRRIVTYEYVLLAGVNDSVEQAEELVGLLQTHPCKCNLIPFNPVDETGYKRPSIQAQERFKAVLDRAHIPTTIRYSKGKKVDAACGQLRRRVAAEGGHTQTVPAAK
ncbi:MAG TPA: 23S rRNA (adenine(2503)-C(2))-methyltransferase RlmN [Planctomycetota bacterium]|nr:23S rRNA (adenine(2503)-C(2))-methyltransferase RlmN [Planctomycetota bacterium]